MWVWTATAWGGAKRSNNRSSTSNTTPARLAGRVWCTKFQSSLLNIYFRLSGFQVSLLLIYFRDVHTSPKYKVPCKRTQHCWPTTPSIVGCYMLRPFAHPVACCWKLLRVVGLSFKPVKLFSQQLPTFLLFHDSRSVAQQCWIRLHSSSNFVGTTHAHNDALQVPNLLGVVASVCTPLPTRTQQLPTLLAQQCWELLRPFAHSLKQKLSDIWRLTFESARRSFTPSQKSIHHNLSCLWTEALSCMIFVLSGIIA